MGLFRNSRRSKIAMHPDYPPGALTDILNDFLVVHGDAIRDLYIRGQDAHVIQQADINAVHSPINALLQQRLQVLDAEAMSLQQEASVSAQ